MTTAEAVKWFNDRGELPSCAMYVELFVENGALRLDAEVLAAGLYPHLIADHQADQRRRERADAAG